MPKAQHPSEYLTALSSFTDDEEHFDDDIADDGRPLAGSLHRDERRVVRNHNGDVERTQEYEPVPANLEYAVV